MYGTPKYNMTENLRNHGKANVISQKSLHVILNLKIGSFLAFTLNESNI